MSFTTLWEIQRFMVFCCRLRNCTQQCLKSLVLKLFIVVQSESVTQKESCLNLTYRTGGRCDLRYGVTGSGEMIVAESVGWLRGGSAPWRNGYW